MKPRIRNFIIASIVALVIGMAVASGINAYWPIYMGRSALSAVTLAYLTMAVRMMVVLPLSAVSALWLYLEAKEEHSTPWLWTVFGLFFHLFAVAVFYAVLAHRRCSEIRLTLVEGVPNHLPVRNASAASAVVAESEARRGTS